MPLNSSGQISLGGPTVGQSINLELGQPAVTLVSLNDPNVRSLAGVPSGTISMPTDFWGKSSFQGWIFTYTYNTDATTDTANQSLTYDYTNNIAHFTGLNFANASPARRGYWSSYNVNSLTYNFQRGIQSFSSFSGEVSGPVGSITLSNGVYWTNLTVQQQSTTVRTPTGIGAVWNSSGNVTSQANPNPTYLRPTGIWTRNNAGNNSYLKPYYCWPGAARSGYQLFPTNNSWFTAYQQTQYLFADFRYNFNNEHSRENSTGNLYLHGSCRTAAATTQRAGVFKTNSACSGIVAKVFVGATTTTTSSGNYNNVQNKVIASFNTNSFSLLDSSLNHLAANSVQLNAAINSNGVYLDDDGSIYVVCNLTSLARLIKLDTSFNIVWQRSFSIGTQSSAFIDYVDSQALYIQIRITTSGTITYPWLWRLPKDGGKTGTYTINGIAVTYGPTVDVTRTLIANPTLEAVTVPTSLSGGGGPTFANGCSVTASAGTNVFKTTI
jgi:hypothetical protein